MRTVLACAAVLWAATLAFEPAAKAAPIEAYGRLPSLENVALSPSGQRMAYIATYGEAHSMVIQDLTGKQKPVVMPLSKIKVKVRALEWADDAHLMITTSNTFDAPFGLIAPKDEYYNCTVYDIVHDKSERLEANGIVDSLNTVLGPPTARQVHGKTVIFFEAETFPGSVGVLSLYAYEPLSGQTRQVAVGSEDLRGFLIGAGGDVVAESHLRGGHWFLRFRRNNAWQVTPAITAPIDVPGIVGLGKQPDIAIISVPTAKAGIYEWRPFSLKDGTWAPDDDSLSAAQEMLYDPASGLAIGTTETSDRATYTFFDPVTEKHWKTILRAYPGEQVDFMSMSADGTKVVARVFGPINGASYVLVDLHTGHADWLGDLYKDVPPSDLAAVSSIAYPAGDGMNIPAYLTLPPGRPAKGLLLIVLVHGGPASHDTLEFIGGPRAWRPRAMRCCSRNFAARTALARTS